MIVNLIGICLAAAIWSGTYIQNNIAPEIISASQEYVEKMEQLKGEAESFLVSPVVSDFLAMDSEDFENKYDRNQLYEGDIRYCDMAAWQYHGTQLDGFQNPEDYYDVKNIAALRYTLDDRLYDFVEENHTSTDSPVDSSSTTGLYSTYGRLCNINVFSKKYGWRKGRFGETVGNFIRESGIRRRGCAEGFISIFRR